MISFKNVSLIYPHATKTVLENLTCDIEEGEMVLVIGQTGIGKSSILRLINGLVPHHTGGILSGDVSVNGISTSTVRPGELAHLIGIVGQNPSRGFVTDIVEDEIAFGMESHNFPQEVMRKRVEEALDQVGLYSLRNRSIATLSGGEQQRLAIASALVMHPKILVLDEPTSALDPVAAEEILSLLHRLVHDLSITVILSEHRLERVIQFVDRILFIEGEGGVSIGSPAEILSQTDLVPPIVKLSRALNLNSAGLTVREVRRETESIRALDDHRSTPKISGRTLVEVKSLNHSYGDTSTLKDVSFDLVEGELVALMGRNGAGKSTLLKSMAGVSRFESSAISIASGDLRIGYIPQEPADLLFKQSVLEECSQNDRDHSLESGTTLWLLKDLLPSIKPHVHPHDLSEGQKLLLVLAIVIASAPDILILDEPTRGLDYEVKSALIATLRAFLQEPNRTAIMATHDVELAAEISDRVAFLSEGELVAIGPTLDVLLSSPAFAPQVAKVMAPKRWLTVSDVLSAMKADS